MTLRETRTKRAFVYTEINTAPKIPKKDRTTYIIHFSGTNGRGCSLIQSLDEKSIREQIKDQRNKSVNLVSRLPPHVESVEGTIKRTPYDLSFLSQTSTGYQGNK